MMRWIRSLAVFVGGALAAVAVVAVVGFYSRAGNRIRSQITATSIQAVRPGMNIDQLTAQLGAPFQVRTRSPLDTSIFFFDYAEPGWLNEGYAVTVETTAVEVVGVSVEYSDMLVYRCDRTKCPQYMWRRDLFDTLGQD